MFAWRVARSQWSSTDRAALERSAFLAQPHRAGQPSSGRPLDASTRSFFEQGLGHDFSHVRVHTDAAARASAAAHGALAYAAGQDLVFGGGQYQPHTTAGRWLIGHELAHVVQQRGSTSQSRGAEGALEKEAGHAAMRVAMGGSARVAGARNGPAVQFARVSEGGFGKALEQFTNQWKVDAKAIALLKKSATFMALVKQLDPHYVWFHDPSFKSTGATALEMGPNGRALKPPGAAGKRALFVTAGGGSRFEAFGSPDNEIGADIIAMEPSDTPGFIQRIAHEATHAAAFVGAAAPSPQTLVAEIQAGIQDEVAARTSEAKILKEVPDPKVQANVAQVGSRDPRQVERDVSPAFDLTYLELYFFARELRDAQAAEKLDEQQAAKLREEIDRFRGAYSSGLSQHQWAHSRYGRTWFDRNAAKRDWQLFMQTNSPLDKSFEARKEKMLQDHAKWFFYGKASYRP